jgi:hypothetical protein
MGIPAVDGGTDNGDLEAELDRLEEMENKKLVKLGGMHSDTPPFMVSAGKDKSSGKD